MPAPRRSAPEPLETADVAVVTAGTVLWGVGLVLTLVFHDRLAESGHGEWVWIMAAGLFLGLIGVRHVRRRRAALHPPGTDRSV